MTHQAKVVAAKQLNDEQVSYRVRCCDDPTTDSCHTASVLIDHTASLNEHIQAVQNRHDKMTQWRAAQGIK